MRVLSIVACLVAALPLTAAEPGGEAERIAAGLIRERAAAASAHGQAGTGRELSALAAGLEAGRVSLDEALQVVRIADALATGGPVPARRPGDAPRQSAMSPEQVVGILDRPAIPASRPPAPAQPATSHPLAPTPSQPQAPTAAQPPPVVAAQPPPPTPAQPIPPTPAQPVAGTPADPVASTPASPALVPPTPARITTTVLAISRNEQDKPALIMVGAGAEQGVAEGQRFAIRHGEKTVVVARVTQVKPDMSVCVLLPESWVDQAAQIREGDVAATVD